MGFGTAWKKFWEVMGWKAEKAADEVRTAEVLLDRVDDEIEIRAQQTLDQVNAALTYYGKLQQDEERLKKDLANWEAKVQSAAARAKAAAEGSPERAQWTKLTRDALVEKNKFAAQLKVIQDSLAMAKPDADKALEMVQEVGFKREEALSLRQTLLVANATAKGKNALANAQKSWGTEDGPGKMLAEAEQKVNEAMAKAHATEAINEAMPASAADTAAKIDRATRTANVDAELAELLK